MIEHAEVDNLRRPEHIQNPCPVYKQLRVEDAVHWNPLLDGWLVTRYEDVLSCLQDVRLSSRTPFGYTFKRPLSEEEHIAVGKIRPYIERSMFNMDPPEHTRQRSPLLEAFTPRSVEPMRRRIQQIVDKLLDDIYPTGRIELIHQFAYPLLFTVIFELLGIPVKDRPLFQESLSMVIKFNSVADPAPGQLTNFAENF